jgi:cytochrome P450
VRHKHVFFSCSSFNHSLSSGRYLGEITKQFQDEYGDTFHLWIGLIHLICVCNPDDVQHVFTHRYIYEPGHLHVNQNRIVFNNALLCNTGAKYKRHAAILLPLFRRGKILNNYDLIVDCTDKLLDLWQSTTDRDPNHIHLNTVDQCQHLSLAIFGFLGFNYDLQTLEESNINKTNKLTRALHDFFRNIHAHKSYTTYCS